MKNKLIVISMIFVLMFTMISCVDDRNVHKKNSTGTLKSDNENYMVPDIFVDVQEGEHHDNGESFGDIILIP